MSQTLQLIDANQTSPFYIKISDAFILTSGLGLLILIIEAQTYKIILQHMTINENTNCKYIKM